MAAYREVVRSAVTATQSAAQQSQPSPVQVFVLASHRADQTVRALGAEAEQTPTVVHLSQEIWLQRPVQPSEQITIELDVLGARRDARGARLSLRSVLTGAGGQALAELVTGVLLTGVTIEPFGEIPTSAAPTGGTAGESTVLTRAVPAEMPPRYADVSGDDNPIHLDTEAAQAAGFPGVIAHGMSVMALICEEVIDRYADGDAERVRGVGGRFSQPVLPEESLEIALTPDEDGHVVRFSCKTPRGPAIKSGWVEITPAQPASAATEEKQVGDV
ncbi:hypothetical protein GCM10022402_02420 [Salinactinospora qingdaonensis]|uniref:MaoC-like domain-containing protein n=2 Tax=Salinactinospora qingdaonensis TaxID=702744 RepID=A0ABP7EUM6_9ACTN